MPATILVVEDEPSIPELIALNLEQAGQRPMLADSAEQALERIQEELPDLVLLDWMLPGQSGLELARKIREDHPAAQVVLMTASESPELRASASIVGVLGLLVKPFRLEALFDLLDLSLTPAE